MSGVAPIVPILPSGRRRPETHHESLDLFDLFDVVCRIPT